MNKNKKIAIILFNLGGPDKPENIRPFLQRLFWDKAIIDVICPLRFFLSQLISITRAPKAKPLYELMGGGSPLLKNTIAQKDALLKTLNNKNLDYDFNVFIAMRYWHPLSKKVAKDVIEYAPDDVIILPLYPHFSKTTTGSSLREWGKYYRGNTKIIKQYPTIDGYIKANANNIIEEYKRMGSPEKIRILFSAHGLPQKIIDAGDPYEIQINQSAKSIKELLPHHFETQVCFQSKVGPLKWLTPSTEDEIKRAANDKIAILICPIAFVSEHIETLVELDVEYKELAHHLGINDFGRSKTVGTNELFIESLSDLIIEKIQE